METKADCGKYEHLEEFRADVQTIVHNVVIYHGGTRLNVIQCFLRHISLLFGVLFLLVILFVYRKV